MKTNTIKNLSSKEFVKIVNSHNTFADIFRELDIPYSGGNYRTLKSRIKKEKVNIDHIALGLNNAKGKKAYNRKSLDEILVKNSSYTNITCLKGRLVKENVLEYKCNKCENTGSWQGESLSLQLDHINGINDDHRINNLQLLCPNCHSQTETYAEKKHRNVNFVEDKICSAKNCNKVISKKAEMCRSCRAKIDRYNKNNKVKNRPSLQTLEKQVKELGYVGTGKRYGVSDNCIRSWIKKYKERV